MTSPLRFIAGAGKCWQHNALQLLGLAAALLVSSGTAHAVPSYARQTGAECSACHVGGFGPQLTPYGIKFKINGYTDTDGGEGKVPLSAMLNATSTHTDAPGDNGRSNNTVMQEASVFVAGRLAENIGSFVQVTYSGVDRVISLDQMDLRYVRATQLGGKDTTFVVVAEYQSDAHRPLQHAGPMAFSLCFL